MHDLVALVPMGSVALLFWFVMRAVLGADRRERAALADFDAREVERAVAAGVRTDAPAAGGASVDGVVVGDVVDVRRERTPGAEQGS